MGGMSGGVPGAAMRTAGAGGSRQELGMAGALLGRVGAWIRSINHLGGEGGEEGQSCESGVPRGVWGVGCCLGLPDRGVLRGVRRVLELSAGVSQGDAGHWGTSQAQAGWGADTPGRVQPLLALGNRVG